MAVKPFWESIAKCWWESLYILKLDSSPRYHSFSVEELLRVHTLGSLSLSFCDHSSLLLQILSSFPVKTVNWLEANPDVEKSIHRKEPILYRQSAKEHNIIYARFRNDWLSKCYCKFQLPVSLAIATWAENCSWKGHQFHIPRFLSRISGRFASEKDLSHHQMLSPFNGNDRNRSGNAKFIYFIYEISAYTEYFTETIPKCKGPVVCIFSPLAEMLNLMTLDGLTVQGSGNLHSTEFQRKEVCSSRLDILRIQKALHRPEGKQ